MGPSRHQIGDICNNLRRNRAYTLKPIGVVFLFAAALIYLLGIGELSPANNFSELVCSHTAPVLLCADFDTPVTALLSERTDRISAAGNHSLRYTLATTKRAFGSAVGDMAACTRERVQKTTVQDVISTGKLRLCHSYEKANCLHAPRLITDCLELSSRLCNLEANL